MNREEFIKSFYEFLEHATSWSVKARREGLLALEEMLDENKINQRDIFEYGMRHTLDGQDAGVINKILSNIINQEKDEYSKTLKTIQKEAVLSIQCGENPRMMFSLLNSYTDLPLDDPGYKKMINS